MGALDMASEMCHIPQFSSGKRNPLYEDSEMEEGPNVDSCLEFPRGAREFLTPKCLGERYAPSPGRGTPLPFSNTRCMFPPFELITWVGMSFCEVSGR